MTRGRKKGLWTTIIFTGVVLFIGVKFQAQITEFWNTYVGKYFNATNA